MGIDILRKEILEASVKAFNLDYLMLEVLIERALNKINTIN